MPRSTTDAPNASPAFKPCPKYQTLMQREKAFRALRMRFVVTALPSCPRRSPRYGVRCQKGVSVAPLYDVFQTHGG